MDNFFSQETCDRCGASLKNKGRTMSMFNTDCICMKCKEEETKRPDYAMACDEEAQAVRAGNFHFLGIGYETSLT